MTGWRAIALGVVLLAVTPCLSHAQVREKNIPGDPVTVTGGKVAGKLLPNGVKAYFGIPFAAPPILNFRWKEPQPVIPWRGVRQAVAMAPACMQPIRYSAIEFEATSEDCLYLNIWTPPGARPGAKLPVVYYLFGGGFSVGSGSLSYNHGANLARKGVIFVGANYRVGALGFMAHPELAQENPYHASGNYGLLDAVAVLKWIKANIARFGGDPNNVLVVGHSAGSVMASALHASPMAKGMFQKVMGISASSLTYEAGVFRTNEQAEQAGLALQGTLKAKNLAEMRALPADRLVSNGGGGGPSIDGYFMPKNPMDVFAAGEQNDVTAFVGFTRDEGYGPLVSVKSAADYQDAAARLYGQEQAAELLAVYPATSPDWKSLAQQAGRDITVGTAARRWAMGQAQPGSKPSYVYMSAMIHHYAPGSEPPADSIQALAYHGSDLPFWLDDLEEMNAYQKTRAWTPADHVLATRLSDMLVAFAKTGNPSIPGIAVPRYDPKDEKVIALGQTAEITTFPGRDHAALLLGLKVLPRSARPQPAAAASDRASQ